MDFIPDLDNLSAADKAKLLEQIADSIDDDATERPALSDGDVAVVRRLLADADPGVRAAAVAILCEYGPVTWEDAERWTLDEDKDVRYAAFRMDNTWEALGGLCLSDRLRCAGLFAANAKRYGSFVTDAWLMCMEDKEWVDPFWSHLGPLLDLGDPELNSSIICGILEDFLDYGLVKVDDSRVQSWITGDSIERKMALLSVVQWFGMREPWQQKIAEALANDTSSVVASTAKSLLARQPVPDIQCREWAR